MHKSIIITEETLEFFSNILAFGTFQSENTFFEFWEYNGKLYRLQKRDIEWYNGEMGL